MDREAEIYSEKGTVNERKGEEETEIDRERWRDRWGEKKRERMT